MVAPSSIALGSSARPSSPVFARRCTDGSGSIGARQRVVPPELLIPTGHGSNGAGDFDDAGASSFSFFGLGSRDGSSMAGTSLRHDGAITPKSRVSMTPPRGRPSPRRLRASSPRVSRVVVVAASAGSSGGRGVPSDELPPGASGSANAPLLSALPAPSWSSQGTSPRGSAQPSSPHQHAAHGSPMSTIAPMAPLTSSANTAVTGGNSRDSHVCSATNVTVASAAITAEMAEGISAAPSASAILSSLPRLASLPALPAMPALTLALPRMRRQKEWFQEQSPANVADIPVAGLRTAEEFEAVMMEVSMAAGAAMGSTEGRLVVVDFFAPWCDACKAVYPTVCEIAAKSPDVIFLKFNLADNRDLGKALGVKILPFFHFYRGQPTKLDAVCATIKTYPRLEKYMKKYNA
ncbi:hypothetical protein CLOM_g17402 [Closterium sp. NIES-68]|nr:hypothetical protein CLOM_g17402 [Closterium sp. NIES-68]